MATARGTFATAPPEIDADDKRTWIQLLTPVDEDTGKATFYAYWIGTDHMRFGQVRAQIFHTNVEQFKARQANGVKVMES